MMTAVRNLACVFQSTSKLIFCASSAAIEYDLTKVNAMRQKTADILAAKIPQKQKMRRGIQFWLHGNKPDGFQYEDYI